MSADLPSPAMSDGARGSGIPRRAKGCRHVYGLQMRHSDGSVRLDARVNWCCALRRGITLKSWRCVGLQHPGCPNVRMSEGEP